MNPRDELAATLFPRGWAEACAVSGPRGRRMRQRLRRLAMDTSTARFAGPASDHPHTNYPSEIVGL